MSDLTDYEINKRLAEIAEECKGHIAVDADLKHAICLSIITAHQPDAGVVTDVFDCAA